MKQQHSTWAISGICAIALTICSLILAVPNAYPEAYIGGQIGTAIKGNKLARVDLTDFSPSGSMSGRDLANSPLLGGKIGYYFPQARWFGLELEASYRTPHIEQQDTRVSIQPGSFLKGFGPVSPGGDAQGVLSGDHLRVITIAPNIVLRYHKTRLQPYVGVGPGIFIARVKTIDPQFAESNSSVSVGLNVKGGVEYYITRHLTVFGEAKWNYTKFDFERNSNISFTAIYNPIFLSLGANVHF